MWTVSECTPSVSTCNEWTSGRCKQVFTVPEVLAFQDFFRNIFVKKIVTKRETDSMCVVFFPDNEHSVNVL